VSEIELLVRHTLEAQVPLRLDRLAAWDDVLARAGIARSAKAVPKRNRRSRSRRLVLALAVGVVAVIVVGSALAALGGDPFGRLTSWLSYSGGSPETPSATYFARRGGVTDKLAHGQGALWAPDGSLLLIAENDGLHVLRADGSSDVRLQGSGGVPIWSPDSRRIAYYDGPGIYIVDADGSSARRLLVSGHVTSRSQTGFSWSPDGKWIVFATTDAKRRSGLFLVNTHGVPRPKRIQLQPRPSISSGTRFRNPSTYRGPTWSPDGSRISFQWDDGSTEGQWVYAMRADGTGVTRLHRGWIGPWSPDGRRLLFTQGLLNESVWVIAADGAGVRRLCDGHCGQVSWFPDGSKLVYFGHGQIVVVRPDGSGRHVVARTGWRFADFSLSPDGATIAYTGGPHRASGHDLYVVGTDGSGRRLVTHSSTISFWSPTWRPVH
jgi:Tol biopolymer transport system component